MQDAFYTDKLYPLQDKVLQVLSPINTVFYLTGGTVLSRHYFNHRYSDDLDFFTNNDSSFQEQTQLAINALKEKFEIRIQTIMPSYALVFVLFQGTELRLDFVNDVPYRVESSISTKLFPKTDNWKNILSNKITALQREAPKDIADLIFLCKNFSFQWPTMIEQASMKDMWVNELEVSRHVDQYDVGLLSQVKWQRPPDFEKMSVLLKTIAKDILLGTENSLVEK